MKQIRNHNNQIAINVKGEPSLDFTDAQDAAIDENLDWYNIEWCEEAARQCGIVEKNLRKRYPSFDIRVSMAGRSGGWCEMSGNWGPVYEFGSGYLVPDNYSHAAYQDVVGSEHKHNYRILTGFIIPVFENEVAAALVRFKEWCYSFVDGLSTDVCDDCGGTFPSDDMTSLDLIGDGCPSDYACFCPACYENARKLDPGLGCEE